MDHGECTSIVAGAVETFNIEDLSEIFNEVGYQDGASLYECRVGKRLHRKIKKASAKGKQKNPAPASWGIRVVVLKSLAPDEWYMVYLESDGRLFVMDREGNKRYFPEEDEDEG